MYSGRKADIEKRTRIREEGRYQKWEAGIWEGTRIRRREAGIPRGREVLEKRKRIQEGNTYSEREHSEKGCIHKGMMFRKGWYSERDGIQKRMVFEKERYSEGEVLKKGTRILTSRILTPAVIISTYSYPRGNHSRVFILYVFLLHVFLSVPLIIWLSEIGLLTPPITYLCYHYEPQARHSLARRRRAWNVHLLQIRKNQLIISN